tara:strand:+ start:302 stop:538 length:237 start_codon:yes stop_codon:yes gene_type:complete
MTRQLMLLTIFLIIFLIIIFFFNCWLINKVREILWNRNIETRRGIIYPMNREIEMTPIKKYIIIQNPEHISIGIEETI